MKAVIPALEGTGFAWLMTTLGSAVVFLFRREMKESVQRILLGFAAGVMIAASVWSLLIPAIEQAEKRGQTGWIPAAVGFVLGGAFLMLMDRMVPHLHLGKMKAEGMTSAWKRTTLMILAVTLHNIPEGMAVGLSFANAMMHGAEQTSAYAAAFALAVGIGIQNFPEGAAISLPLRKEGMGRFKAFLCGSLSGIVEPVFGVITVLTASFLAPFMPVLLAFAAGAMVYVAVEELIPEANSGEKSHIGTIGIMGGFLVMMILDVGSFLAKMELFGAGYKRKGRMHMYQYSIVQWLFFFYFYCFFGWCFESCYVSLKKKKLVNRGFMRGPFLPLYGSGAIMMLIVSMPFQENLICVYLAGCVGATVLEYVTGVVMEALFKVRYWDYSNQKFNFQGHICLGSSLAWGGLTIFMTEILHKPIERFVLEIPEQLLTVVTILLTMVIAGDFVLSFKAALDLRDMLIKLEKIRQELERMQKRLDVILAVAESDYNTKKQEQKLRMEERVDEIRDKIETQFETLKDLLQKRPGNFTDSIREEVLELRTRFHVHMENHSSLTGLRDFYKRNMIRSNPGMSSLKFKEVLEELKETAEKKKSKKKRDKDSY